MNISTLRYKLYRRKVNKVTLSRGRFLNLNAIDILGRMIFLLGGWPCIIGCIVSSFAPFPLDARRTPVGDNQKGLQTLPKLLPLHGELLHGELLRGHLLHGMNFQQWSLYLLGSLGDMPHKLASMGNPYPVPYLMAHFQKHQGGDSWCKHQRWIFLFYRCRQSYRLSYRGW